MRVQKVLEEVAFQVSHGGEVGDSLGKKVGPLLRKSRQRQETGRVSLPLKVMTSGDRNESHKWEKLFVSGISFAF